MVCEESTEYFLKVVSLCVFFIICLKTIQILSRFFWSEGFINGFLMKLFLPSKKKNLSFMLPIRNPTSSLFSKAFGDKILQEKKAKNGTGTHFVLVHGSCCGAWTWHKLVPLLEYTGNKVTNVDLAACGINKKQVDDLLTYSDHIEPLMQVLAALPPDEKVVLVGHSMGGIPTSVAMERFPHKIRVAVFLTAYMPGPNLSKTQIDELLGHPESYSMDTIYTSNSFVFGPQYIANKLYTLSEPEDISLASSLARPYKDFFQDGKSPPECTFTDKNYGSVRRVFILSGDDNEMKRDMQLKMIEKNPPGEIREVPNSDHMVQCSQPIPLLSHLLAIAQNYN